MDTEMHGKQTIPSERTYINQFQNSPGAWFACKIKFANVEIISTIY